jgi:hypothetical protein
MDLFRWGVTPGPPVDVEETCSALGSLAGSAAASRSTSYRSLAALGRATSKESFHEVFVPSEGQRNQILAVVTNANYLVRDSTRLAISPTRSGKDFFSGMMHSNYHLDEPDQVAELSSMLKQSALPHSHMVAPMAQAFIPQLNDRFVIFHPNHLHADFWSEEKKLAGWTVLKSSRGLGGSYFCFDQRITGLDQIQPVLMHDEAEWKLVASHGDSTNPIWNEAIYFASMPPKHRSQFGLIIWNAMKLADEIFVMLPTLSMMTILNNIRLSALAAKSGIPLALTGLEDVVYLSDYGERFDSLLVAGINNKVTPINTWGTSYAAQLSKCLSLIPDDLHQTARNELLFLWQDKRLAKSSGWDFKALCARLMSCEFYVDNTRGLLQMLLTILNYDLWNRNTLPEVQQCEEDFVALINHGILTPVAYSNCIAASLPQPGFFQYFQAVLESRVTLSGTTKWIRPWVRRAPHYSGNKVAVGTRDSLGGFTLELKISFFDAQPALNTSASPKSKWAKNLEQLQKLVTCVDGHMVVAKSDCFDERDFLLQIKDQIAVALVYVPQDLVAFLSLGATRSEQVVQLAIK